MKMTHADSDENTVRYWWQTPFLRHWCIRGLLITFITAIIFFALGLLGDSAYSLSEELLVNPGFETGDTTGWSNGGGGTMDVGLKCDWCDDNPHSGLYQAYWSSSNSSYYAFQEVDLSGYAADIDAGTATINATGWLIASETGWDSFYMQVRFYNAAHQEIVGDRYDTGPLTITTWAKYGIEDYQIPIAARSVEIRFNTWEDGWDAGGADDFSVKVGAACTDDYSYRKRITIDHTHVDNSSDLLDFPVMVVLTGSDFQEIEDNVDSDGYDIVFRASDGTTPLAHEIEVYDETADLLVAWVKIPLLSHSADTVIYLYYGNSCVTSPTENPGEVWSNGYEAVWHLSESGSPDTVYDSTSHGRNLHRRGDPQALSYGNSRIGGAIDFDGMDDYYDLNDGGSLWANSLTGFTLEAWVYRDDGGDDRIICRASSTVQETHSFSLQVTSTATLRTRVTTDPGALYAAANDTDGAPQGQWVHMASTWNAATGGIQLYTDGLATNSANNGGSDLLDMTEDLCLANINDNGDARYLNGRIDEARVSSVARSSGWMTTQFNNQNSPSTFFTVEPEVFVGGDTEVPSVTITSPTSDPTYSTEDGIITLGGSASDDVEVVEVTWTNDRGGSGVCSGTTNWTAANIPLSDGNNVITITALDAAGKTASDVITVTYTAVDAENPTVAITSPTSDPTYSTDTATITLGGSASDDVGVVEVTWTNDRGGSGVCSGTTNWTAANIPLFEGNNIITLTARDGAGKTASDVITVTYSPPPDPDPDPEPDPDPIDLPGCATGRSIDYGAGFNPEHFDLANVAEVAGQLVLQTGSQAIDPEHIVIPFDQEVFVTFLYEGTSWLADFGWFRYEDAVDASGNFIGFENIPLDKKHPIFSNMKDDGAERWYAGDGIFDAEYGIGNFPYNNEAALAAYDDGTGLPFIVDGDNVVTFKDMKKCLGTIAGGTEIVFWLVTGRLSGGDMDQEDHDGWSPGGYLEAQDWDNLDPVWGTTAIYYSKKDWNPDTYGIGAGVDPDFCNPGYSPFDKIYRLGDASGEVPCEVDRGWLDQGTIDRLASGFGITLSGEYHMPITLYEKYPHVVVGAPPDDPKQWILGIEDRNYNLDDSDMDHNDVTFRIERKTGGTVQLKADQAVIPPDEGSYYTAVTFSVYDSMAGGACAGKNSITYFVSIDNGANWVEITGWDVIQEFSIDGGGNKVIGADVPDWSPGTPELTYRSRRVDFAGLGLSGNELVWKALMVSEDDTCVPEIVDVVLNASAAKQGFISRSSPIVQGNVLYSGSYETPASDWTDREPRGHVTATRIYDPLDPDQTATQDLWDAGTQLNTKGPDMRTIHIPNITVFQVTDSSPEILGMGDGTTTTFSGTLAHHPIMATTVSITDQHETFSDKHTDVLEGNLGGTGTINRFTGAFEISFDAPPGNGVPIKAIYSYYTTSPALSSFTPANLTNAMLGLDDTYVVGVGYKYDFDGDGDFDEADGDWLVQWVRGYKDGLTTPKEWLLGAIDHSIPAVAGPPGIPEWYFGTATTEAERASFDTFRETFKARDTVLYVGSRDGMIHAFNAGKFRWGDNPDTPGIEEHRGYFKWEGTPSEPNYGNGDELWAFIPNNLLPRLKKNVLSGDDQAFVDASPAIADVFTGGQWRTVLLCAEGNGGDTVFALDVTDSYAPQFLWEFADPDLFRSRSSPAIAQIGRIVTDGEPKWAAFFVSGKTYDPNLDPSVYIVNIADGSVIERVFLTADAGGVDGTGGVPSGQPAIVDSDGNGYIDRVYIGTDKGLMYKINMPDYPDRVEGTISHCIINTDFVDKNNNTVDVAQRYHPIYACPAVVVDNEFGPAGQINYRIKIFFGTGDSPYYDENINTAETRYHFFAYFDRDGKGGDGSAVELDWFFELPPGHRIFASAFAAAGNVYFGTSTTETEDPCSGPNQGILYGITEEGVLVVEQQAGDIVTSPVVADEHLYFRTRAGIESLGSGKYNNKGLVGGVAEVKVKSWREVF